MYVHYVALKVHGWLYVVDPSNVPEQQLRSNISQLTLLTSIFDKLFPIYILVVVLYVLGASSTYDSSLRWFLIAVIAISAAVSQHHGCR